MKSATFELPNLGEATFTLWAHADGREVLALRDATGDYPTEASHGWTADYTSLPADADEAADLLARLDWCPDFDALRREGFAPAGHHLTYGQAGRKKTIRLLDERFSDSYVLYAPELEMPETPAVAERCFPAIAISKTCDPLLTTLPYYILISELGEYEEYRSHPALGYIYAAFGGREKLWQTLLDHARRNPCFRDDAIKTGTRDRGGR